MNIVRKIHDLFRVKTVAGAQLETPEAVSSLGAGGSTSVTIASGGASLNGSGLSEEDRVKLDSIELGALVNLDAFSKIQFDATSIDENDLSSSSNGSIIANVPTDTANIKIVGNYPITVNLESVSLFNSNTSTTTGTAITTYNISFNDDNNIVIEYVDGALLNVADIELIQVKHKEDILATYLLSDITYTTSEGTITSFTIPYSNTDFSEIEFCKYETITTETETGSTTVRELRVLSTLPASPTKQSIITLNSLTDSFWNYEEDENGNKFVWTDYNVYSTKDVSAYGRGTDLGDTYASNLYELKDVVLTNLSNNDLLIYNSSTSKWVNINKDLLGISADLLHTLTISVNGVTQTVYNPASANASINISTIALDEVTEYIDLKIDTKLDASEFFKWFTINYDSNNNVVSIQANFDFYSIEGVSAYGLGEGEEEPSYVYELGELRDVTLTNVALNNILLYDGNKWVNRPMSSIVVDAYTKSEIDTKLSSISSEISTLKSNVTSILSNITGIRGDITNIQSNITNIQGDITNILSNIATILNSISGITSDISTINATISDILTTLTGKLDKNDFFTWFTIIKNTSGEVVSIQANFDFYSIGEVSAYGLGDIGGSGRTTLATLDDVSLSNLITNDMLAYNGSKWVNIPMSQVRGVTSWADLENKPTTLSGFGITDAYTSSLVDSKIAVVSNKLDNFLTGSDTDTIINKWKELESFLAGYTLTQTLAELLSVKANSSVTISAGTGLTGGGDLTANRTISLSTSGVSAGTYTKVTVDAYGRVTSGSTLSASDIPNLDWSKITSGKPTTLVGYGITDGVNSITITGTGNAITAATITDHILTLTKGNTFLLQSIFDDLFEKVNIGTTASPVYAIKAKYHFYSVGEVSAYEFGDTSGGGASALYQLVDILPNDTNDGVYGASTGKVLMYNGTKWQAGDVVSDISTLTFNVNGSKLFDYNGKSNVTANLTVPTKLSQLTDDVVSGKYLPLSGGTMSGSIYIPYSAGPITYTTSNYSSFIYILRLYTGSSASNTSYQASIGWHNTGGDGNGALTLVPYAQNAEPWYGTVGLYITQSALKFNGTDISLAGHTHSYLQLTGGTITGQLNIDYNSTYPLSLNGASSYSVINLKARGTAKCDIGWLDDSRGDFGYVANVSSVGVLSVNGSGCYYSKNTSDFTQYIIYHSGNLNTSVIAGLGTLSNNISGNAATATNADNASRAAYVTSPYPGYNQTSGTITDDTTSDSMQKAYNGTLYPVFHNTDWGWSDTLYWSAYERWGGTELATQYNAGSNVRVKIRKYDQSVNNWGSWTEFITSGNIGSQSVNYANSAGNADTLDGYHKDDILRKVYYNPKSVISLNDVVPNGIDFTSWDFSHSANINNQPGGNGVASAANVVSFGVRYPFQIYNDYNDTSLLYFRSYYSSTGWKAWRQFAFIDSNVASAAKLATSRTLWGQSFDGTANISGDLTGVSNIYMTSNNSYIYNKNNLHVLVVDHRFTILGYGTAGAGLPTYIDGSPIYMRCGTSYTEALAIINNGNVGIGTTSPAYKLDVSGNIHSSTTIVNDASMSTWEAYELRFNDHTCGLYKNSRISSGGDQNGLWLYNAYTLSLCGSSIELYSNTFISGNVGIGTASPSVKLHVVGDIAATGAVTAKASSSDIRLKTDISDYKALSIIRGHKSIKYHWNEAAKANADIFNDNDWHFGLIAQEMQQDLPQMVSDVFKDYLVINYERLIPICWKGLQEVDDEVTKLKKRVKQLERRLLKYESTEVFYTKGND